MISKGRHLETIPPVARQLKFIYRDFHHYNKKNPLDELLFILCSVKRSEQVYLRAYQSLKQTFPTYEKLNQASVEQLSSQINWGGLQNQKSRSVKALMTALTEKFGKPTLAPLRKMTDADCESFLCSLPGIDKKIARCVMLFSLNRKVFPVDSNCWRIAQRLGWIEGKNRRAYCSSEEMDLLQDIIPSKLRLSLHINLISFGRSICVARSPKCGDCPISEYCSVKVC
jgi:endonuclease III